MEVSQIIYTYLLTVPVFFAIDLVWLGVVAKSFYRNEIGNLLADTPNWGAAMVFYLAYIYGIIHFAVLPGVENGSLSKVLINGALFGGLAYATYDLTNLATLKSWSTKVVVVDIIWGIILTMTVALISYQIATRIS